MLSTAAGEILPLTRVTDTSWHLKVLINNENVYIRIDVWAACHECPPSWVRCLSPESVERRTTPQSPRDAKGPEVKKSSSPEQIGAAGRHRYSMLDDVDELMPAKPWVTTRNQPSGRWKRQTLPLCIVFLMRRISPCHHLEMRR